MITEQMWACPCTTCGGRGFGIDVHSAENKWQCAECGHFYVPANRDYRARNAKCPKCGSTCANGWFDDDDEDFLDEDDAAAIADGAHPTARELSVDEELPWDDTDDDDDDDDEDEDDDHDPHGPYDLGITWKESDAEDDFGDSSYDDANFRSFDRPNKLPDDIDFPHHRDDRESGFNDDDIPF
jgi:DNA-directed RNA polymerase subunit RPC12/RpoP